MKDDSLGFLFGRRSIRSYEDREVPDALVRKALEAAMAAPSAVAKDPWRFIVMRNADTRVKIAAGLPNGKMLASAPLGVVICGDLSAAHGGELSYMLQDCSAATENMLIAFHALGLGACWLGVHPRQDRVEHLRAVFSLPERIVPVAVVAAGYPAESKPARSRYEESYVHREAW